MPASTGILYLVSTPIGNLGDLSPRAVKILESVKYILCESVQHTAKLFSPAVPVPPKLFRYEGKGYRSQIQRAQVISDLQNGRNIALASNAGTPLISDPGAKLVSTAVQAGFPVVHIPGPAAFVSAVVASGLPTQNILFIGFLPKKETAMKIILSQSKAALSLIKVPTSLVFYVSKYRIKRVLFGVKEIFGKDIRVSIAREMTKIHEEHFTGALPRASEWLNEKPHRLKGEFTLVIQNSQ